MRLFCVMEHGSPAKSREMRQWSTGVGITPRGVPWVVVGAPHPRNQVLLCIAVLLGIMGEAMYVGREKFSRALGHRGSYGKIFSCSSFLFFPWLCVPGGTHQGGEWC